MESKLRELIGKSNVWLYIQSGKGWVKDVEILDVNAETLTFRYEYQSRSETKIWEKTTRINNVLEIDIRLPDLPEGDLQIENMRDRLSQMWEGE